MLQVRQGVFETNSSSTHSITMCMKSDFEKWKKGEMFLDGYNTLITKEQAIIQMCEDELKYHNRVITEAEVEEKFTDYVADGEFKSYDMWGNSDLEGYEDEFTTPSGETIVAFGEYGYDG